jgi:phosphoribosylformimino-5-aminoimidazole carboxamide ribotide isomerase
MPLTLYPAIDLLHGRRMRHARAEIGAETGPVAEPAAEPSAEDDDPLVVARRWRDAGATWLHVVDLDGALAGQPKHLDVICALAQQTGLALQVGGGLRTEADVAAVFEAGAARVVLEAAAGRNPELLAGCLARWGEAIALSVDARGGQLTVAGWLDILSEPALGYASRMAQVGVRTLLVTNVAREDTAARADTVGQAGTEGQVGKDGQLGQVGLTALREALPHTRLIAAGDIATLDDIHWLARVGMDGAVLGRALAEGALDIAAALEASKPAVEHEAQPAAAETPSPTSPAEPESDAGTP